MGPKKAAQLYKDVGYASIEQLKKHACDGQAHDLKGLVEDGSEHPQRDRVQRHVRQTGIVPVSWQQATDLRDYVQAGGHIERIEICGSLRRRRETIADIDILASSTDADKVMQRFVTYPQVREVLGHGATKSSILLTSGMQADLSGCHRHAVSVRPALFHGQQGTQCGHAGAGSRTRLELNEYELAGKSGSIACMTEADIFAALGLQYVPPELREKTPVNSRRLKQTSCRRSSSLLMCKGLSLSYH